MIALNLENCSEMAWLWKFNFPPPVRLACLAFPRVIWREGKAIVIYDSCGSKAGLKTGSLSLFQSRSLGYESSKEPQEDRKGESELWLPLGPSNICESHTFPAISQDEWI